MKKNYLLSFLVLLLCGGFAHAQMIGTNTFLQGRWLEIGIQNNGAFGASTPPAGYHPFAPGTGWLAEVYDLNHDGWTVGTPNFNGDYTYPGSPFEGWELQVNGLRNQCFQSSGITGGGSLTGASTSYSNVGGRAIGNWAGTASTGGLQVFQETRVDTLASWVVVTTRFVNTTGAAIPNIYYLRSCDPDNDQAHGGSFATDNLIVHQNEDARHMVQVNARGLGSTYNSPFGLCTKDCRAKAFIYSSWSIGASVDLAGVWSGSSTGLGTATFNLGGTQNNSDVGIGLVYNVGTIPANDSAIISYAYYFLPYMTAVDSAFPDPQLVVNGVGMPVVPPPMPNKDTVDVCGLTNPFVPAIIKFASDKNWSWSKWTWSPALGLATTTGVNNVINTSVLPSVYTYTITGTDSATGMASCNKKVFYLTIKSCNNITISTPCIGDTMKFNAPGDSTGATYKWYKAPSTAVIDTHQKWYKYPTTWADTGVYTVIKTVLGVPDTATTYAFINPLPTISGTLSICLGTTSSLTSNITGSTWSSSNPSVATVNSATGVVTGVAVGTSIITCTSPSGCKNFVTVTVFILPSITGTNLVCQGATTTLFDAVPGGTWTSGDPSVATIGTGNGIVGGVSGGTAAITYSVGGCTTSWFVTVTPTSPITGTAEMCQYFTTTLSNSIGGGVWASSTPAVGTISSTGVISGLTGGTTNISYTSNGCTVTRVATVHPKPAPPVTEPVSHCQFSVGVPVGATNLVGHTLTWYGPGVTPASPLPPVPNTDSPITMTVYVTQTSPYGCVSDSAMLPVTIKPQPPAPTTANLKYCQDATTELLTAVGLPGATLNWYTASTGGTATGAPSPSSVYVGNQTFYVSQTLNGCEGPRNPLTVEIIYKPNFTISVPNGKVCQHDTLTFNYNGPALVDPTFLWELPIGASFAGGSSPYGPTATIRFDTTWGQHIVKLTATNLHGQCATTMEIDVTVIPQPAAYAFTKHDVCIHDTVSLALQGRTTNAEEFLWWVDGNVMKNSPDMNIVTSNVKSGGPYLISWNKSGRHIIQVKAMADNDCPAKTTSDTVNVHELPDATFSFAAIRSRLCQEDSVLFTAKNMDYNCSYEWTPTHFFNNLNKPTAWGRIEQAKSVVMLKVTDPFGCVGFEKKEFNPESCCTVTFPTAFSPNQDGHNDRFRPIFAGYHRFHTFKVTNRWGQTVFESSNSDPSWDGSFGGVPQDMGVYFYYIKYDCGGKTLEEKGEITLVR